MKEIAVPTDKQLEWELSTIPPMAAVRFVILDGRYNMAPILLTAILIGGVVALTR